MTSSRRRTWGTGVWSVAAFLALWLAVAVPYQVTHLHPTGALRLPLEVLLLVGLLVAVPGRVRRPVAALGGVLLGVVCVVKVLDIGFELALGRPFAPLTDASYATSATSLLFDSVGTAGGIGALSAAGLGVLVVLLGLPLAAVRLAGVVSAHRTAAIRGVTALAVAWVALAVTGATVGGRAIASSTDIGAAVAQARQIRLAALDERRFEEALTARPAAAGDPRASLGALRGKDVLLVFVESYGRFAIEGPASSGPVGAELEGGTHRLDLAGYQTRSAFLTSPTFGGISWLAHSTLQTGLWVDSQARYDRLLETGYPTLTGLFGRAGWRTVMAIPSSERPWPEGSRLYRFDTMYGGGDVGYVGPRFGYAKVPDQYTLDAFSRLELDPQPRRPVMAEIDLDSSHTPWTPLPRMVPWDDLGDGSVFDPMPSEGPSRAEVWSDRTRLRAAYARSVAYSLDSIVGLLVRQSDEDLVVVVLGDHQPNTFVTGRADNHDVPVSIVARDPAVIDRIDGWGWRPGLRPEPDAPVWRMDDFRARFLDAYAARGADRRSWASGSG